jgi:hypothetical protein
MDLEVEIEGVTDVSVVKEIIRSLRRVFKDAKCPGEWRVVVSPSETRGQWDIGVRGPFGHHFASVNDRAEQLPERVAEQLQACLRSISRCAVGNTPRPRLSLQS